MKDVGPNQELQEETKDWSISLRSRKSKHPNYFPLFLGGETINLDKIFIDIFSPICCTVYLEVMSLSLHGNYRRDERSV